MALNWLKKLSSGPVPYLALALMLFSLAFLLSAATVDSSRFSELFLWIFALAFLCVLILTGILSRSLYRLYRDYRSQQPGSRFTVRLVGFFVALILVSTTVVYGFSVNFLHRGINSWFDVRIEEALSDSLELSRTAFGIRMRTLLRQTRMMAGILNELPNEQLSNNLRELINLSGALELSVWTMSGQLLVSSLETPSIMLPVRPSESILRQLSLEHDYIGLDPSDDGGLQLRAAIRMFSANPREEDRLLHALFPVSEELSSLGRTVQDAYANYKELSYLRQPLISIFTLSLSLILLLTVVASLWFALWISRRIVEPLQALAAGTQAVASGNYNMQLTASGQDEIGFLVRSFNQMTQRLTQARNASQRSHKQLEQQTQYLTTVLASLSSGVITIDEKGLLRTANVASSQILDLNLSQRLERSVAELAEQDLASHAFFRLIRDKAQEPERWQQELELYPGHRRQTLLCQGTPLSTGGWLVVFDDVTDLLQAQRNAAWGEVARRLAHEIKNPLTPIQLSAERLQHKYQPLVPPDQAAQLTKLTQTIVTQVEAMKEMVNEFSDYARSPELVRQPQCLAEVVREVLALYQGHPSHHIQLSTEDGEQRVALDANRFRQVLHNLLKNAIEASEEAGLPVEIALQTEVIQVANRSMLQLSIGDQGPGFEPSILSTLFEPYTTTKARGTGLGLAIVKKIIEEHGGAVWAENRSPQGARIIITLPLEDGVS